MSEQKIGWGVLSTAQIARKNWFAIRNSGNGTIVAVASRDPNRSRQFIAECQAEAPMETLPQAFGRYEELLTCEAVQAVYIPLPTGLRKEWVLKAAAAGKHIVCEKPCAASVGELREMLAACRKHRVQFMDGVMFMHSRRLDRLREVLDDPDGVGPIKRITSAFSFGGSPEFFTDNIRTHGFLEPYGCLGDLGWYCLRFSLWGMKFEMPTQISGRILSQLRRTDSPAPVPTEFSGELWFAKGASAGFYCSFVTGIHQWANISGEQGYARLEDFPLPYSGETLAFEVYRPSLVARGCDFKMEPHCRRVAIPEYGHGHSTAQETNLFRNFSELVRAGRIDEQWPHIALKTQIVMAACLDSARQDGKPVEPATP
jgi:predicted dehydrogenase